jgi:predicted CXXCH cytochrome family protein
MKTLMSGHGNRLLAVTLSAVLMGVGLLFSATASAQADNTEITGSPHDFSGQGWSQNGNSEICIVCHTPHNTISPGDGPLWNRGLTTVTSYTLYSPNTVPGSDIQGTGFGQPSGVSRLCLSCHDGTIAVDSFGRNTDGTPFTTGTVYVGAINANANIGDGTPGGTTGDLSNDHPVAFTFPTTDTEIVTPAGGQVAGVLPLFGTSNDQMECATCHDVHATGTFDELLRVDNAGSDLCLTCHIK